MHKQETYEKYRFRYDPECDIYWCSEKNSLYWKTTTHQGNRQYFSYRKICENCPRRNERFGKSTKRSMVERHVWQDELDEINAFMKTPIGKNLFSWREETIESSFAEAKT